MSPTKSSKKPQATLETLLKTVHTSRISKPSSSSRIRLRSVSSAEDSKDFYTKATTPPRQQVPPTASPRLYVRIPSAVRTSGSQAPLSISTLNNALPSPNHDVNSKRPDDTSRPSAMDRIITQMSSRLRAMEDTLRTEREAHSIEVVQLKQKIEELEASLDAFNTGTFTLTFTPGSRMDAMPHQSLNPTMHNRSEVLSSSLPTTRSTFPLSVPSPPPSDPCTQPSIPTDPLNDSASSTSSMPDAAKVANEENVPMHRLSREVKTIPDLWQEWTVGLPGQPSIDELDRQWGPRWRRREKKSGHSESGCYSKRKVIIDELRRRAVVKGGQEAHFRAVVEEMEKERLRRGATLTRMYALLRGKRKHRPSSLPMNLF